MCIFLFHLSHYHHSTISHTTANTSISIITFDGHILVSFFHVFFSQNPRADKPQASMHHFIYLILVSPAIWQYSDSVWHCLVFDPLRVVRAKLFGIVHSIVTRSFIRGAWRGSCDTSLPSPIISLRLYRRFGPVLRSPYVRSFHYLPLSCKHGPKTV